MGKITVSVIIPTHNRPAALAETLAALVRQTISSAEYEIVVVDDGSDPPVTLAEGDRPVCRLLRLEGVERSAARNAGVDVSRGSLIVFLDDDMIVGPDFLETHAGTHREWPGVLAVGAVRLPQELWANPFGRFRQQLEWQAVPIERGPVSARNFCTAQNMSIGVENFRRFGGFDRAISSGEDQEFALRHTAGGGRIVFVPEAEAIHRDHALDIRSYCRRHEWGMEAMLPFCQRHPEWPDHIERGRVNGAVRWGREPLALSALKLIKSALGHRPFISAFFGIAAALERVAPESLLLDRIYRLLLGLHLFRGYRQGLRSHGAPGEPS